MVKLNEKMKCKKCKTVFKQKSHNNILCRECAITNEQERARLRSKLRYDKLKGPEYYKMRNTAQKKCRLENPTRHNMSMARCYLRKLTKKQINKLLAELDNKKYAR